jgi:hypothetical protein
MPRYRLPSAALNVATTADGEEMSGALVSHEWRYSDAARIVLLAARLLLLGAVAFASGCRRGDVVATIESCAGTVERQLGASPDWGRAGAKTGFRVGDAVRTQSASTAELALFEGSHLTLDPDTLVRFRSRVATSPGARLDVELGQATLEVAEHSLDLELTTGSALVAPHSKVRLGRNGAATRIEVIIGSARLLSDQEKLELHVGEAREIVAGQLLLAREPSRDLRDRISEARANEAASAAIPGGSSATPVASTVRDPGSAPGPAPGPALLDLDVAAGDSFIIHSPRPPVAIGFSQSRCPAGAILTLDPDRAKPSETQGAGRVSALVPAGTHRYVIACVSAAGIKGDRVAHGSISVMADDGSRKLAKSGALSNVDMDGRRYTVLYQSQLPALAVTWPKSPPADGYTLLVHSSGGARSFSSKTASYVLPSGAIAEGEHTLAFEGGGQRSKVTNVVLRFDNAAPTASISAPADGSFAPGSTVRVAGMALPGWTVSVAGRQLEQDAQNRFADDVTAPAGQRGLWIRFSHPSRGIHYYLRRGGE